MAVLPWIQYTDRLVGKGHPTLADEINAPLRQLLTESDYNPDADPFPGLMGPVFNIRARGAVPGGAATGNTTAIQAAINDAEVSGGTVVVPQGTYDHNDLTIDSDAVILTGLSSKSVLRYNGTGWGITVVGTPTTPRRFVCIRDVRLDAAVPADPAGLLRLQHGQGCRFRDLFLTNTQGATSWGISVEGASRHNVFRDLVGQGGGPNLRNGVRFFGIGADEPTQNSIVDSFFVGGGGGGGGVGVHFDKGAMNRFIRGDIVGFDKGILNNSADNIVEYPYLEALATGIETTSGGTRMVILFPRYDSVTTKTVFASVPWTYLSFDDTLRQHIRTRVVWSDITDRVDIANGSFTTLAQFGGTAGANFADLSAGDMYVQMQEQTDPSAPPADMGRFYFRDNGAGKTQFVVRFPTGAVQVIATEP